MNNNTPNGLHVAFAWLAAAAAVTFAFVQSGSDPSLPATSPPAALAATETPTTAPTVVPSPTPVPTVTDGEWLVVYRELTQVEEFRSKPAEETFAAMRAYCPVYGRVAREVVAGGDRDVGRFVVAQFLRDSSAGGFDVGRMGLLTDHVASYWCDDEWLVVLGVVGLGSWAETLDE